MIHNSGRAGLNVPFPVTEAGAEEGIGVNGKDNENEKREEMRYENR